MPYTLLASQCPVPPCATTVSAVTSPHTSPTLLTGDGDALRTKFNELGGRADTVARWGGGCYAVAFGLEITAGAGLTLNIAAGQAVIDGIVPITATTRTLDNNIARVYLWLGKGSDIVPVNNSLTPPAGAYCFIGSAVTSGGAITSVDQSGILCLKGGTAWRRTADTDTPTDTPPVHIQFFHRGASKLWWWDGTQYWEVSCGADMSPLALADGGTGATGQLVLNPTGNVTLTATQAGYSNIELRGGGPPPSRYSVTFPSGMVAGREWAITNTSGQTVTLVGPDGSEIHIPNQGRITMLYDGTGIKMTGRNTPWHFNKVVTAPTYTFSYWDEVVADYIEFTPSGGNVTVNFPNAAALYKRGHRFAVKNDHSSQWIDIKTNGAGADRTVRLLPGETRQFVVDDGGAVVPAEGGGCARRRCAITMADATHTVTAFNFTDYWSGILEVSGVLTAPRDFHVPTVDHHEWVVRNSTGQTITVKTAAGTGVAILNGKAQTVYCDGTNVLPSGGAS